MAPYLLFGFAVAGLLRALLRADFIEALLGKPGLGGVVKASVLGVPMPLCSCSVIPVAALLRESGASRGATASFLSSTPQTGIDSIFATYGLLGGAFTAARVLVAFVCGIVTGYLIELFVKEPGAKPAAATMAGLTFEPQAEPAPAGESLPAGESAPAGEPPSAGESRPAGEPPSVGEGPSCCAKEEPSPGWRVGLHYGFVALPNDLAGALITGLLLAGLIAAALPDHLLAGTLSVGPLAFLLATIISLPLYVCATASIPIACSLIAAGLSPGAALVFPNHRPGDQYCDGRYRLETAGSGADLYLPRQPACGLLAGWRIIECLTG